MMTPLSMVFFIFVMVWWGTSQTRLFNQMRTQMSEAAERINESNMYSVLFRVQGSPATRHSNAGVTLTIEPRLQPGEAQPQINAQMMAAAMAQSQAMASALGMGGYPAGTPAYAVPGQVVPVAPIADPVSSAYQPYSASSAYPASSAYQSAPYPTTAPPSAYGGPSNNASGAGSSRAQQMEQLHALLLSGVLSQAAYDEAVKRLSSSV